MKEDKNRKLELKICIAYLNHRKCRLDFGCRYIC